MARIYSNGSFMGTSRPGPGTSLGEALNDMATDIKNLTQNGIPRAGVYDESGNYLGSDPFDVIGSSLPDGASGATSTHNYDVKQSSVYLQAYTLFSSLSDKQWLSRLEMIPNMYSSGEESFTDSLGITQDYMKRRMDNYNSAITQIQNLVNEYYAYVNSLPVTQANQLSSAGVNAAITGQGLNASSVKGELGAAATQHGGTDATGFVGNVLSFATSTVSTLSSLYSSVQSIKTTKRGQNLQDNQFVASFIKTLSDSGYSEFSDIKTSADLLNFLDHGNDPEVLNRRTQALVKALHNSAELNPYMKYISSDENGNTFFATRQFLEDSLGVQDEALDSTLNHLATYRLQKHFIDLAYGKAISEFNYDEASILNGTDSGESKNATFKSTKASEEYNKAVKDLQINFLKNTLSNYEQYATPEDKFVLMEILFGLDFQEQAYMDYIAEVGSAGGVKLIEDIAGVLKTFKGLFKPAKSAKSAKSVK